MHDDMPQRELRRADGTELRVRVDRLLDLQRRLETLAQESNVKILEAVRGLPVDAAHAALDDAIQGQAQMLQQLQLSIQALFNEHVEWLSDDELTALMQVSEHSGGPAPEHHK